MVKEKKTEDVNVKSCINFIGLASDNLKEAIKAASKIEGCPERITKRIDYLRGTILRTGLNIKKKLGNLGAKAEKAAAAAERKADKLAKAKARVAKLNKDIAEMEK